MGESNLSYDDLLKIVELIQSSPEFNEFHLRYGDIEIDLRKRGAGPASASLAAPSALERASVPAPEQPPSPKEKVPTKVDLAPETADVKPNAFPPGAKIVKSPMVGTFYAAPEPGGKPFVTVGERVEPDSTVCIIEVMKLMNSIHAEHAGVITHILVKDGEPVEFGQPLIVIDAK